VSGHHRQAETLGGSGRSLRLARGPTEHTKCGEIRFVENHWRRAGILENAAWRPHISNHHKGAVRGQARNGKI